MSQLLRIFIMTPVFGFLISLLVPKKWERGIFGVTIMTVGLYLTAFVFFAIAWLLEHHPVLDRKHIVLFRTKDIEIFIDFYFDKITAMYAGVGAVLMLLVTIFSRYYLHREEGFKRFFTTLLLFFSGYNLVIFSGNFETLFMGWELLGISSFLLITFYRDRYLPVKNGMKVLSIYRLGDICLILTMWMSHQLWHENITFIKLNDWTLVKAHLEQHNWYGFFIALMIVLAAATKSAQLPFSSWLPRAMEGPTTSSAIFYGSLSVHLGAFLLLRTYPYWEGLVLIKVLVIAIGLSTSIIASGIARVQSSVKTQIAYSSVTQIGLIFIEIALGFHTLALIHFAGNAFLRTYQLLVSPSVMSYLVHDMFFKPIKPGMNAGNTFFNKIRNSLYILSVKEWNLDAFHYRFLWNPFKWIGNRLGFLSGRPAVLTLVLIFLAGLYCDIYPATVPRGLYTRLPLLFSIISFLLIVRAFTERGDAKRAWLFVILGQLFISLSIILLHDDFGHDYMLIYLSGSLVCYTIGYICLKKIERIDRHISLDRFHGYTYERPVTGFIFLLACLGVIGFPFSPTFIGIDLLFSHIHKQEIGLILLTALSFIFIEVAVIRIYARIFMGQHKKAYHPIAFRSS